ncbi:MarR family winged helix-turn-helix transcriptional regulator [Euzebya tangerina]|uniref:MarR family winged helix-turn-helix transcriptional regulator n=1 Tax=Euzebya tangerina TaxID=591198 RepID=UPI00196B3ABF|nr:MarR family transcriptional regulator [Euzebya tangerina]
MDSDLTWSERRGELIHLSFMLTGRLRALMDQRAAELDLSPMQARALWVMQDPTPMGELAEKLHCDASNVTGIVDRLEDQGLMERVIDPDDRRRRNLVVTEEGRARSVSLRDRLHEGNPVLALTDDEVEVMLTLLGRMLEAPD